MRTHEVEKLLGIKRERIRYFKEKHVFTPEHPTQDHQSADYTEADIEKLKELIVLTTAGLTCDDIKKVQDGTRTLAEVIIDRRPERERKRLQMDRSMELNRSILMESVRGGSFDVDGYWAQITQQDTALPFSPEELERDKFGNCPCKTEIVCPYCGAKQTVDLAWFVHGGYPAPDADPKYDTVEEFDSGMAPYSRLRCRQCRMPIQIHGTLRSNYLTQEAEIGELILEPDASYDPDAELHAQHEKELKEWQQKWNEMIERENRESAAPSQQP